MGFGAEPGRGFCLISVNVVCMFFPSRLKKGKKYVNRSYLALYMCVSTDLI